MYGGVGGGVGVLSTCSEGVGVKKVARGCLWGSVSGCAEEEVVKMVCVCAKEGGCVCVCAVKVGVREGCSVCV